MASSSSSSAKAKVPNKIANGKFETAKKLGAGCFGEVFRGKNTENGTDVAIKFEDANASAPQLEHEASILNVLRVPVQPQGFTEYYFFGMQGMYRCMVMEYLGKSLEDYMQICHGKFQARTATLLAEQIVQRIEYLHSKGIVHRDIKSENFMMGHKNKIHHVYLIDFGLSKKYYDTKHVEMRTKLSLTGTARYASINAHRGIEQSRRDDLEAIGHMLLYFLRGSLPWSGLDAKTKQEKYRKIMEKKDSTPVKELCAGFPDAFEYYLTTARNLEFKERPDYNQFRKMFRGVRESLAQSEGPIEDHSFEWLDNKDTPQLVPLQPAPSIQQPDDTGDGKKKPKKKGGLFCFCGGSKTKD